MTSKWVYEDAFNTFAGELLGEGIHRKVFAHRQDPTLVIKVEQGAGCFSNIGEWDAWMCWGDAPQGRWLAPCVALSPRGSVLLQRRVQPLRPEELPAQLPSFLTDTKAANFGMYQGRVVCCDYGSLITSLNSRMRKVHWHDG